MVTHTGKIGAYKWLTVTLKISNEKRSESLKGYRGKRTLVQTRHPWMEEPINPVRKHCGLAFPESLHLLTVSAYFPSIAFLAVCGLHPRKTKCLLSCNGSWDPTFPLLIGQLEQHLEPGYIVQTHITWVCVQISLREALVPWRYSQTQLRRLSWSWTGKYWLSLILLSLEPS